MPFLLAEVLIMDSGVPRTLAVGTTNVALNAKGCAAAGRLSEMLRPQAVAAEPLRRRITWLLKKQPGAWFYREYRRSTSAS